MCLAHPFVHSFTESSFSYMMQRGRYAMGPNEFIDIEISVTGYGLLIFDALLNYEHL